jgi:hypothetical protein
MFEVATPDALIGEIEASHQQESALMARRCAAIAALLCSASPKPRTLIRIRGIR